jgi:hypothetical protein
MIWDWRIEREENKKENYCNCGQNVSIDVENYRRGREKI